MSSGHLDVLKNNRRGLEPEKFVCERLAAPLAKWSVEVSGDTERRRDGNTGSWGPHHWLSQAPGQREAATSRLVFARL